MTNQLTCLSFQSFREHPEIRSLGAGPMVSNISSILVRAATSPNPKVKFSELSTHDTGVAPLLCALDAFDGRWPNFASNVGFELHRVRSSKPNTGASDHYVRVLYNLRAVNLPWCVKDHYPGDASLCSLKAFKEFADNLMPKDYAEQCAKPVEK